MAAFGKRGRDVQGIWRVVRAVVIATMFATIQSNLALAASERAPVGLANPASVHCGKLGGRLQIVSQGTRGQVGFCHLPDGRMCEEWALFRDGKCVAPKR